LDKRFTELRNELFVNKHEYMEDEDGDANLVHQLFPDSVGKRFLSDRKLTFTMTDANKFENCMIQCIDGTIYQYAFGIPWKLEARRALHNTNKKQVDAFLTFPGAFSGKFDFEYELTLVNSSDPNASIVRRVKASLNDRDLTTDENISFDISELIRCHDEKKDECTFEVKILAIKWHD